MPPLPGGGHLEIPVRQTCVMRKGKCLANRRDVLAAGGTFICNRLRASPSVSTAECRFSWAKGVRPVSVSRTESAVDIVVAAPAAFGSRHAVTCSTWPRLTRPILQIGQCCRSSYSVCWVLSGHSGASAVGGCHRPEAGSHKTSYATHPAGSRALASAALET